MKASELQTILGYLNIGLAVAHNIGVKVGHFGSTDFLSLAQDVNGILLASLTPVPATQTAPAPVAQIASVKSAS